MKVDHSRILFTVHMWAFLAAQVIDGLFSVGLTSFMSGMDNVRNLTGNPIAGVDPHELIDTRPILKVRKGREGERWC
jgi:sulfite reductase beta subunit-like hemoprotein